MTNTTGKHRGRRNLAPLSKLVALLATVAALLAVGFTPAEARVMADAPPNSVGEAAIKTGAVTYNKLGFGSVTGYKVADKTLYGYLELVDGSVGPEQLNAEVNAKLDAEDLGQLGAEFPIAKRVITNIGGPFAERATKVVEFDLLPGVWMVYLSGVFHTNEAIPEGVRPQLALRYAPSASGNGDAGTIMGAELSPRADRELTGSASTVVRTKSTITVTGYAHGYTDTAGSEGSGQITVAGGVTLVRIGN